MTAKPTDSDTSGELESLDDLINKRQLHSSLSDQQPHENGIGSVSSADDPNASSLTIRPDSPPTRTARPRDESRWNGFHLWRTESHNARATRERDAAEMRQQNTRQRWLAGLVDSVREWYASVIASISTRKEEESRDENEKMSSVKMLLLTIVSAGTQVSVLSGGNQISVENFSIVFSLSFLFPAGMVLGFWLWNTLPTLYWLLKADHITGMACESNHWIRHAASGWCSL